VGGRSARIKTRPVRDGPLGKVWRGLGGESRRITKKIMKRENFAEKIVHTEQPRKKFGIEIPKYLTENLAMRTKVKYMPSFLASVQSGSSFKRAF